MKLGFVTAILPELSFDEVLQKASQIGYDCVEVMCWPVGKAERRYAGVTHIDLNSMDQKMIDSIHRSMENHNVDISALGYYPNPLTPDKDEALASIKHLRLLIESAPKLGLSRVNSFVGRDWTKSVEDNWFPFVEVWKPLIELAEKSDVKIGIENCPMLFTKDEWPGGKNLFATPKIWRKAFDELNSDNFGLNFDPSHFIWQQMDYFQAIQDFGSKFYHVHAKDARIDIGRLNEVGNMGYPNDYHTPKLPGLGDVNWQKFFSALTDVGYDGPVCVEVEDRAFEGSLEKRIESLKLSYNYLRQFIPK